MNMAVFHASASDSPGGRVRRPRLVLAAAALIMILGVGASLAGEASTMEELRYLLANSGNGDSIVIGAGLSEVDLAGVGIETAGNGVALTGSASRDMKNAIQAGVSALTAGRPDSLDRQDLDARIDRLVASLTAGLSSPVILNSAAAEGTHAGISAPKGGFSLKNLTFAGTTANIDASTGASKYLGLVGSTFSRSDDPLDGQGMGTIENVAFIDNVVNTTGVVHAVGNTLFFTQRRYTGNTYTQRIETLDAIIGSLFRGNRVTALDMDNSSVNVGPRDIGAGGAGWASITAVDSSVFADNFLRGHHAFGAGLHVFSLGDLTNSLFYNNINESDHDGYGGGLYSGGGVDSIRNSVFVGNEVRALDFGLHRAAGAQGGAVHSAGTGVSMGYDRLGLGEISNSLFAFNRVYNETGEEANGGAVYAARKFDAVTNSVFYGNVAESDAEAFGGAIALSVNAAGMSTTITDSLFIANRVDGADGESGGGAIAIDTITAAAPTYTLNLKASAGGVTRFAGNTVNGAAEGIYVGKLDGTKTNQTDVTINIDAAAGGLVALEDPIRVNLDNGKKFFLTNNSAGRFVWGGANDLSAAGGSLVKFFSGSNVSLSPGFSLASSGGKDIAVDFDGGANVNLVLSGRDADAALFRNISSFANVQGTNVSVEYYSLVDYAGSWVVAEGGAAAGLDAGQFNAVGNADTKLTLSMSDGKLLANISHKGPDALFAASGPNGARARPAMQELFEKVGAGFDGDAQKALLLDMVSHIGDFTSEAFMTHGVESLAAFRGIAVQALGANNRSRGAALGGQASALAADSALASISGGTRALEPHEAARTRFWADYVGDRSIQKTRDGYSGYKAGSNGVAIGGAYDVGRAWSLGAHLSYADGYARYRDLRAEIDSDIYQFGVFAQYRSESGGWLASLDFGYAHIDNDSVRYALGRLEASYGQDVVGGGLEGGYEFRPWCNGRLTPFAGIRGERLWQGGILETGGVAAQQVAAAGAGSCAGTLGVNLAHEFAGAGGTSSFTPGLHAAWRHEFADRRMSAATRFVDMNAIPAYESSRRNRDSLEAGASIAAVIARSGEFSLGVNGGYNVSIAASRVTHSFYGGLELGF